MLVAKFPCSLSTVASEECNGGVQAHHLLKPLWGTRGMGMKASDNNTIPLCQYHHALLHFTDGNEDKFWTKYGLDAEFGRMKAHRLWKMFQAKYEK